MPFWSHRASIPNIFLTPSAFRGANPVLHRNIIEPIRYPIARNHLPAKFSAPAMQDLRARTAVIHDPRSTISSVRASKPTRGTGARLSNGRTSAIAAAAQPISDDDLDAEFRDAKFRMRAEGVSGSEAQPELLGLVRQIDQGADLACVMELIAGSAT
jgi:hypothetical protein